MVDVVNDFITKTLRFSGIVAEEETPAAYMSTRGLELLNDILGEWGGQGVYIPYITTLSFTMTIGDGTYTIGTSGYDVTANPIIEIVQSKVTTSENINFPQRVIGEKEYNSIIVPTVQGVPSQVLLRRFPQYSELLYYPLPIQAYTANLVIKQRLLSVGFADSFTNIPNQYYKPLRYTLARELMITWKMPIKPAFESEAQRSLQNLFASNRIDLQTENTELNNKFRYGYYFNPYWG